jgi:ADP-ribose pyrophosphatase YjhB (NUDIX family)
MTNWLHYARRLQAIAQTGLTFSEGVYDRERYEEIRSISIAMMHDISGANVPKIRELFAFETGYQTPKVDIRGVVFEGEKILMIKETADQKWALPGGWADINYSPSEIVVKEVQEEAGLDVVPVRLMAVFDKLKNDHPPDPYHAYKLFFLCEKVGGSLQTGTETLDVGYFAENQLPELSTDRNTERQITMMFDFFRNPHLPVYFD